VGREGGPSTRKYRREHTVAMLQYRNRSFSRLAPPMGGRPFNKLLGIRLKIVKSKEGKGSLLEKSLSNNKTRRRHELSER
jgi:hypothetical protein